MKRLLIGLMVAAIMIGLPMISQATPGANVLITDNPNHNVIEVNPTTGIIEWEYGVPTLGSRTLYYPNEAIPLTNGNILIADTYMGRILEVTPGLTIAWQYGGPGTTTFRPVDVRRCRTYTAPYTTGTDTLLITDIAGNHVFEITYPGGIVIWDTNWYGIGLSHPWEAEKRPGTGTPRYLITDRGNNRVIEVDSVGTILWNSSIGISLNDPRDAEWLPCNSVLITDTDNRRVLIVEQPGAITTWQWSMMGMGTFTPYEATMIENGNILIAGAYDMLDDRSDGIYPTSNDTRVLEVNRTTNAVVWQYGTYTKGRFVDVNEKGIINIAKIEYQNLKYATITPTLAGVVVPIYQPIIIGTPTIAATKTVFPTGSQTPGAILTYTIVLRNTGSGVATNVTVIDQIPPGTSYVFDSDTPEATDFSHNGGITWDTAEGVEPITHLRWLLGSFSPGQQTTLQFRVQIQ